jgi:hypothetical protein
MTEEDLSAIDQLMKNRDHFLLHSEDFSRLNGLGLMDKVPDLVAEVRRLKHQNEGLRGRLALICNGVEQYVSTVGPEQLGSKTVKVWLEAMAKAREGWGGECGHKWMTVGHTIASAEGKSGPIERCQICGEYKSRES